MKLSLISLAAFLSFINTPTIQAKKIHAESTQETPEEKALNVFRGFFTDPNYEVTKSFKTMCHEAIPYLEKSSDPDLKALAKVLRTICTKANIMIIGGALVKYSGLIQNLFGDMLPAMELKSRLNKAIAIK